MLQFLQYIFPIIALPYLGNVVGPKFFGIVNFLSVIVGYFSLMVTYGFDVSATREVARNAHDKSKIDELFSRVVSARLALFIAATTIFAVLNLTVPELKNHTRAAYASFLLVFGWVLMPNWYFQGTQKMDRIVPIHFVIKLAFVALLFWAIQKPEHYYRYPLILSCSTVAVGLVTFLVAVIKDRISFRIRWDMPTWDLLWKERYLFTTSIINNTYQTVTIIMLGFFVTFEEVGIFSLGWRLMNISQALIGIPLVFAMLPHATLGFQLSKEEGLNRVSQNISTSMLALVAASTLMIFVSPWLVNSLFGTEYSSALTIFRWLILVPLITGASATLSNQVLLNIGRDRSVLWITAAGALVSIALNIILLPNFGTTGSAIAIIATETFTLFMFWQSCRQAGYQISVSWFSPAEVSSAVRLLWTNFTNRNLPSFISLSSLDTITLIIPTYNRPNVWIPLIESINKQLLLPNKIIVIDQSTQLEARAAVKHILANLNPSIQVDYVEMSIQNRCVAKDTGFHRSPNGMVVIIDDDVVLPEDALKYIHNFLTQHPDRIVTPRIVEPDQHETSTRNVQRFTWYGHFYNNNNSTTNADGLNSYSGPCFGFIKSVRNSHFHYEPSYIGTGIHEETDFARQFIRAGYSISFRSAITIYHFPQKNGNAFFKDRDPFPWYADSFFNFGMYHRKFGMTAIFFLRIPYMCFFGIYVGLFKYPGRRNPRTAWHLATQFIRGYRAWPPEIGSKPAVIPANPH